MPRRQARTRSTFAHGGVSAETKPDTSPVTIADKENELIVREAIEREFPDDGILGEEGSSKAGSSRRRWIVDPIDGTRDFVRGNRFWCVLIALEEADEPVVGVAHFPMLDETYWAVRGGGAYLNRERLRVSAIESINSTAYSAPTACTSSRLALTCRESWNSCSVRGPFDPMAARWTPACLPPVWWRSGSNPRSRSGTSRALKLIIEEAGGDFFALDGSRRIDRGTALGVRARRLTLMCAKPSASYRPESTAERHAADRSIGTWFRLDLGRLDVLDLETGEPPQ